MNEKFWALPKEKQDRIINSALEVFARNEYKKAPMSEIASAANISKSLLFHYFHNKRELFLFLYDYAINFQLQKLGEAEIMEETDFMEMFRKSVMVKCQVAREYTYMNQFLIRAYFEDEPEIADALAPKLTGLIDKSSEKLLDIVDKSKFKEESDAAMLLKVSVWIGEGYMLRQMREKDTDINQWEKDFLELIEFWKKNHYKNEDTTNA